MQGASKGAIVIAGGGLGGLTAAIALADRGFQVRVLEQTPEIGAIGYGIQLGPNVFSVLDELGLSPSVLAQSHRPDAVLMLDARDGAELIRIPTGPSFLERFGNPYAVIHRVDLHHALLDACAARPGITLESGCTVTGYENKADRVTVRCESRESIEADVLIGADGLRSGIRARIVGDGEPSSIGYAAHRTIVPMESVPDALRRDEVILWGGDGFHIVQYPLRNRSLLNIVAVFRTPTYAEKRSPSEYRREVQETYAAANPGMRALIGMMDLDRRWTIADRKPVRGWSDGRVTLLGDAAHPTLQSLAQGAGMAIEDAVCLADCLAKQADDPATAFIAYERQRLTRTARVQLESRYLWDVYHLGGIARDVRNDSYKDRGEQQMFDCLQWLYGRR